MLLDQVLSRQVPPSVISEMKAFAAARRAHVLSLIPLKLSVATEDLPVVDGSHQAPAPVIRLNGSGNAIATRAIRVNGVPAVWSAWEGKWTAPNVTLHSGINRILVQALDEHGGERARQSIDVLYDSGRTLTVSGSLAPGTEAVWRLRDSAIIVAGQFVVPTGAILHIEAGTTLYFNRTRVAREEGWRQMDRLSSHPLYALQFLRLAWHSFQNSAQENHCSSATWTTRWPPNNHPSRQFTLLIDHMTWSGLRKQFLS